MADVIIVLGRGIDSRGNLPEDPKARVGKGVQLLKSDAAPTLLMSGSHSYHFAVEPPRTEAAAMTAYALDLGVRSAHIVEESRSKDTLGNAYFCKLLALEHRWQSLVVVASDEHMPRVAYVFQKVFGNAFKIVYEVSERVLDDVAYEKEVAHENASQSVLSRWLDEVADGDHQRIFTIMQERHPAYANEHIASTASGTDLYPNHP